MVKVKIDSDKYSVFIGVKKTLWNMLIMFAPAILAFLANVPVEYTPIASFIAYMIKNYVNNK
jgi:hypothetical protein